MVSNHLLCPENFETFLNPFLNGFVEIAERGLDSYNSSMG